MAHRFTVNVVIDNMPLEQVKRIVSDVAFHERVCKRIPGTNLEILQSEVQGDTYHLKRAYNLDVNIPDVAKKFLKDAFRLRRTDEMNLNTFKSQIELGANLPLEARCERHITGDGDKILVKLDWQVKVKIPLISGLLEKHAEGEIRKFSAIELGIVEEELRAAI